jgi:hypothetical protein
MGATLGVEKSAFDSDGYVLAKSVFSEAEITDFRRLVYQQYENDKSNNLTFEMPNIRSQAKYARGDLLSKNLLYPILLDDRILTIARTILGHEHLIYFGDSSYQIGTGSRGFHRDNVDRKDLEAPDWQGTYTLIRIGLYLQSHNKISGGLKVKPGTHKHATGSTRFLDSEVGDVAAWSLKILHSGNAVRLKMFKSMSVDNPGIEALVPPFMKMDQDEERISMFMTFALRSPHLDRYIDDYFMKRDETLAHAKASVYDHEGLLLAKSKNVEILDPVGCALQ